MVVTITGGTDNQPTISLGSGADIRNGPLGEAEDTILGQNGSDQLFGHGGADKLYGGNGDDALDGGSGIDWLYGEKGNDRLTGGEGADTFVFTKSAGSDTVTDFQVGIDHLHLDGITAKKVALVDVDHTGALDLVVHFSNGSVTLLNTGAVANWQDTLFA